MIVTVDDDGEPCCIPDGGVNVITIVSSPSNAIESSIITICSHDSIIPD